MTDEDYWDVGFFGLPLGNDVKVGGLDYALGVDEFLKLWCGGDISQILNIMFSRVLIQQTRFLFSTKCKIP